jgi:lipopolysaccharide transport system ATP-binding protein
VRGLGKKYRLGAGPRHDTLRDQLSATAKRLFGRCAHPRSPLSNDAARSVTPVVSEGPACGRSAYGAPAVFWALRGVSFDVQEGEILGIIGRNGAGKSTLLKILSRITDPTEGEAEIRGRVASLMEVGTGFHPELTGRENIYLNGAILGMPRASIRRRFDEIVAFAEIERCLDTPVKRYSSGMYVRLAFAVAAHLEPEILLVDEVLAVGDVSFQKKCLGKMRDVARGGRTVLFVSHNMAAVRSLTSRSLLLDEGRIAMDGESGHVVERYLEARQGPNRNAGVFDLTDPARRATRKVLAGHVRFLSLTFKRQDGTVSGFFYDDEPIVAEMILDVRQSVNVIEVPLRLFSTEGVLVSVLFPGKRNLALSPGRYAVTCELEDGRLRPGVYRLELYLLTGVPQDLIEEAGFFEVVGRPPEGADPRLLRDPLGIVRLQHVWHGPVQTDSETQPPLRVRARIT